jgi:hypothetical protein
MKRTTRVWFTLIIASLILSIPMSAYAGTYVPTSTWNLSTAGQYNLYGKASVSNLFTNYLFTGVSSARISCVNRSTTTSLKVRLMRDDPFVDTSVSTVTIPKNGTTTWTVTALSSTRKYYVKFEAPCDFTGYIRKP